MNAPSLTATPDPNSGTSRRVTRKIVAVLCQWEPADMSLLGTTSTPRTSLQKKYAVWQPALERRRRWLRLVMPDRIGHFSHRQFCIPPDFRSIGRPFSALRYSRRP